MNDHERPEESSLPAAELASWMDAWQEPAAGGPDGGEDFALRVERVKTGSRRFGIGLLALTAGELLISLGTLLFAGHWVYLKPEPWRWALLACAVGLILVAHYFTLTNRRGTYRPRNQTTQAFVELEWLRAKRQLRTIRFTLPFLLFEMAAIAAIRLGQLASAGAPMGRIGSLALSLLAVTLAMVAVLAPALWLWRRKVRAKMKELEPLRAALAPPPESC
jgi:hypothetical protein